MKQIKMNNNTMRLHFGDELAYQTFHQNVLVFYLETGTGFFAKSLPCASLQ